MRATDRNKVSLYGNLQYARSTGVTTAQQVRLGGRDDQNLSADLFAFGGLDFERNKFTNLALRSQLSGGLGKHLLKGRQPGRRPVGVNDQIAESECRCGSGTQFSAGRWPQVNRLAADDRYLGQV